MGWQFIMAVEQYPGNWTHFKKKSETPWVEI